MNILKTHHAQKLIRDKITLKPNDKDIVIEEKDIDFSQEDMNAFYEIKVYEELNELNDSNFLSVEEYADLIEIVYAIAKRKGISENDIQEARYKKLKEKGGFENGCLLFKKIPEDF